MSEEQTIAERDHWFEKSDTLADLVAAYFGVDFGEHSNRNCPVDNAIEYLSIKVDQKKTVDDFISKQEPLGHDFAKVIGDNAEELYEP